MQENTITIEPHYYVLYKIQGIISAEEKDKVLTNVKRYINTYMNLPAGVSKIVWYNKIDEVVYVSIEFIMKEDHDMFKPVLLKIRYFGDYEFNRIWDGKRHSNNDRRRYKGSAITSFISRFVVDWSLEVINVRMEHYKNNFNDCIKIYATLQVKSEREVIFTRTFTGKFNMSPNAQVSNFLKTTIAYAVLQFPLIFELLRTANGYKLVIKNRPEFQNVPIQIENPFIERNVEFGGFNSNRILLYDEALFTFIQNQAVANYRNQLRELDNQPDGDRYGLYIEAVDLTSKTNQSSK